MQRCVRAAVGAALALACAVAGAQETRQFPPTALRGKLVVTSPPQVTLNGTPARLAPAARIRAQDNAQVSPGALVGKALVVHYRLDGADRLRDVWILRDDELARQPWPTTRDEAAAWRFDPVAQTWSKP